MTTDNSKQHFIARELLDLQDAMNRRVNPNWISAGYGWQRAIWLECAELVDHLPWKWWKAGGDPKMEQIRLEVVDILHFLLSWALCDAHTKGRGENATQLIVAGMLEVCDAIPTWSSGSPAGALDTAKVIASAEGVAAAALQPSLAGAMAAFARLADSVDLDTAELRRRYVGKNALNIARNKLGYATGSYQKLWAGEEDNVHLERLMFEAPHLMLDEIVERLVARYGELNS